MTMTRKVPDAERMRRIDNQAENIAELIGADPEKVMTDGSYGVVLTPDQMDALFTRLIGMGYQNAIDILKATGNAPGGSVEMVIVASFLEGIR